MSFCRRSPDFLCCLRLGALAGKDFRFAGDETDRELWARFRRSRLASSISDNPALNSFQASLQLINVS